EQAPPAPEEPAAAPSESQTSRFLQPDTPAPEQSESFNPLMGAMTNEPTEQSAPEANTPAPESTPESAPPAQEPEAPSEPSAPEPPADLPQVQPQSAPQEPPAAPEQPEAQDDGQIHIDHEGNLIRKAAASPKHKV